MQKGLVRHVHWTLCENLSVCYNKVQRFWVHCLFTGQSNTKGYGIFTGVRTKRQIYANIFYIYFFEMYMSSTY